MSFTAPVKLCNCGARLSTLLQLSLQPTKDMVEREPALPKGLILPLPGHTTHTAQALLASEAA